MPTKHPINNPKMYALELDRFYRVVGEDDPVPVGGEFFGRCHAAARKKNRERFFREMEFHPVAQCSHDVSTLGLVANFLRDNDNYPNRDGQFYTCNFSLATLLAIGLREIFEIPHIPRIQDIFEIMTGDVRRYIRLEITEQRPTGRTYSRHDYKIIEECVQKLREHDIHVILDDVSNDDPRFPYLLHHACGLKFSMETTRHVLEHNLENTINQNTQKAVCSVLSNGGFVIAEGVPGDAARIKRLATYFTEVSRRKDIPRGAILVQGHALDDEHAARQPVYPESPIAAL